MGGWGRGFRGERRKGVGFVGMGWGDVKVGEGGWVGEMRGRDMEG